MAKQTLLAKTRFINAYTRQYGGSALDKSNLAFSKNKAGVYLIQNARGHIVYVGYSETQLEKTVLRHFQSWKDKTQVRVTYDRDAVKVRIVLTTPGRAAKLERALILQYQPKDNPDKLKMHTLTQGEKDIKTEYELTNVSSLDEMEKCPF